MILVNIDYLIEYDRSDPISIEVYSQKHIGMTFRQIWEEDDAKHPMMVREDGVTYGSSEVPETKHNKGNLVQIIEEKFFIMNAIVIRVRIFMRQAWNLKSHLIESTRTDYYPPKKD